MKRSLGVCDYSIITFSIFDIFNWCLVILGSMDVLVEPPKLTIHVLLQQNLLVRETGKFLFFHFPTYFFPMLSLLTLFFFIYFSSSVEVSMGWGQKKLNSSRTKSNLLLLCFIQGGGTLYITTLIIPKQ